jgi:hypothetical protein
MRVNCIIGRDAKLLYHAWAIGKDKAEKLTEAVQETLTELGLRDARTLDFFTVGPKAAIFAIEAQAERLGIRLLSEDAKDQMIIERMTRAMDKS